jgi:gluconokinase
MSGIMDDARMFFRGRAEARGLSVDLGRGRAYETHWSFPYGECLSPRLPNTVFLFGLAGAGKSYIGSILAERFGYTPYDLDNDLTPAIRQAIAAKDAFTDEMRDEYFDVVIRRIAELKALHPRLVLMQGAYKERHRSKIRQAYSDIEFVWVEAPQDLVGHRLTARADGVSPDYARAIATNFEVPPESSIRLLNDESSRDELARRFEDLFSS